VAIKTVWRVAHSCGHGHDHDLGDKRPSERAGYANWLATKECSECWRAERDQRNGQSRQAWLAQRRAEEAAEIETWEHRGGMPGLDGSDKAVRWARRVRYELIVAGHDHAATVGVSDDAFAAAVEDAARKVTSASWWIDQRFTDAADVAELIADGASDPDLSTGTENPF
jgi:hypothetical protein